MATSLKDPNAAENDAQHKLRDPYRHNPLPSGGDADSPYASPPDTKRDINDRSIIDNAERGAQPTDQDAPIEQRESLGQWKTDVNENYKSSMNSIKTGLKKKKIWMALAVLISSGGVMISVFVSPITSLVNFKEVLVGRFSERMEALMERRATRIMNKKISKEFTSTSCSIKIKCRYKGMSKREIKKFEKRTGMKVIYNKRPPPLKNKIVAFERPDGTRVSAKDFRKTLKTDLTFRKSINNFHKPKVAIWTDKAADRFYKKFSVFRGKYTKKGSKEDSGKNPEERSKIRLRERIRLAVSGKLGSLVGTLSPQQAKVDPDSPEASQAVQENADNINVSDSVTEEADAIAKDLEDPTKAIDPPQNPSTPEVKDVGKGIGAAADPAGLMKGAILGPLSVATGLCTSKSQLQGIGYAAKLLGASQLIRYAMVFMNTADKIKAGDAVGNEEAEEVSDLMTMLNSKNPETGDTYSDSFGYQMAAYGKLPQKKDGKGVDTDQIYRYTVGGGATGEILKATNAIDKYTGGHCKTITNPFVQIGGAVAGIALTVATGGTSAAASAAAKGAAGAVVGFGLAVVMETITPMLAGMLAGSYAGTGDEYGDEAGNAATSGIDIASAENAKQRGLYPLTKEQTLTYDAETKVDTARLRNEDTNQFDPTSPYSFTGRLALSLAPLTSGLSLANIPTKLSSFSLASFSAILPSQISAQSSAADMYEVCQDSDFKELGIAADPFCVPQYGFDPGKMSAEEGDEYDADEVINYMYDGGYINDNGDPQGEYSEFIEKCMDTTEPLQPEGDNESPKMCLNPKDTNNPSKYTKFRLFAFDTTIDEGMNEEEGSEDPSETASSEIDLANLEESSVDVACAPNTNDVGIHDGYVGGKMVKIRVCAIPNIQSTGEESGGGYGVKGANGNLVVNSRVSGAVYNMIEAAKKDGVTMYANSGFRTMAHQQALCPCDGVTVAVPGTSNHQLGVAIDFGTSSHSLIGVGDKWHNWLSNNAGRFGYKPYSAEAWHWSPTGH